MEIGHQNYDKKNWIGGGPFFYLGPPESVRREAKFRVSSEMRNKWWTSTLNHLEHQIVGNFFQNLHYNIFLKIMGKIFGWWKITLQGLQQYISRIFRIPLPTPWELHFISISSLVTTEKMSPHHRIKVSRAISKSASLIQSTSSVIDCSSLF